MMLSILILSLAGVVNLFLGFSMSKSSLKTLAVLFFAAALIGGFMEPAAGILPAYLMAGMLSKDVWTLGFGSVVLIAGMLVCMIAGPFLDRKIAQPAEYFSLLLFASVGALMMIGFQHMIMLFLGVETLSIAMYVLAGAEKRDLRSNESALKYLLMGAFATGFLLFGIALLYGATGSFELEGIRSYVDKMGSDASPMLIMGLFFMLIGMLFKVSAAPFHFWTPDVYQGAPTLFTAFMSTVVKTAGFASLYKLLSVGFGGMYYEWYMGLVIIAGLSMLVGNLTATQQDSAKRMMAYSSISHAGYMLMAVAALQAQSDTAVLFYSLAYTVATLLAFTVMMQVEQASAAGQFPTEKNEDFRVFNGLWKSQPLLAIGGAVAMLSLAGIPLTAGFIGKLYVFLAAFDAQLYTLLVFAALMSAVGMYYYLRLIIAMYFKPVPEGQTLAITVPYGIQVVIIICILTTLVLGLMPGMVTDFLTRY